MALKTGAESGQLDYREVPEGPLLIAAYAVVGQNGPIVLSQADPSLVSHPLQTMTRNLSTTFLFSLILGGVLILIFVQGLIGDRLRKVARVMDRMIKGDFSQSIQEASGFDEIGTFVKFARTVSYALQRREQLFGTLTKIQSRHLKELLIQEKIPMDGEIKNVTVFQSGFIGFDEFTQEDKSDLARKTIRLLNEFTNRSVEVIGKYKGFVEKASGGEVIAFWGAPFEDPKDLDNAIQAGLKIRDLARDLDLKMNESRMPKLTYSSSLHRGPAICGAMGWEDRTEYGIMGSVMGIVKHHTEIASQLASQDMPFLTASAVLEKTIEKYRNVPLDAALAGGEDLVNISGLSLEEEEEEEAPETDNEETPEVVQVPFDEAMIDQNLDNAEISDASEALKSSASENLTMDQVLASTADPVVKSSLDEEIEDNDIDDDVDNEVDQVSEERLQEIAEMEAEADDDEEEEIEGSDDSEPLEDQLDSGEALESQSDEESESESPPPQDDPDGYATDLPDIDEELGIPDLGAGNEPSSDSDDQVA